MHLWRTAGRDSISRSPMQKKGRKAKPSEQTLLLSQLSDLDLACFVLCILWARELRDARNEKRFDGLKPDTIKLRVSRTLL